MRKLEKNQIRSIKRNLNFFFDQATNKDIKEGIAWYKNANTEANRIAKQEAGLKLGFFKILLIGYY